VRILDARQLRSLTSVKAVRALPSEGGSRQIIRRREPMVTLEEARNVIAAAEKKAKEIRQPMNIAVAEAGARAFE
jgi:hypothetical protein